MSFTTSDENYIEELRNLKQKLNNQKMSVLVGAGFSKNVDPGAFPSWWQLLYDAAYFLTGADIEKEYLQLNIKNQDRKMFIENGITAYIEKIGYLELISEYIRRKGYREAITSYIEERTPQVVKHDGKFFLENTLSGRRNKIELTPERLTQHKRLLRLPWNNIYTTNYDEMLEFVNDDRLETIS